MAGGSWTQSGDEINTFYPTSVSITYNPGGGCAIRLKEVTITVGGAAVARSQDLYNYSSGTGIPLLPTGAFLFEPGNPTARMAELTVQVANISGTLANCQNASLEVQGGDMDVVAIG